jgi:hypothetical protein
MREGVSCNASSILSRPTAAEIQAAVQAASRLVNSLAEHENRRREHHGGSSPPSAFVRQSSGENAFNANVPEGSLDCPG